MRNKRIVLKAGGLKKRFRKKEGGGTPIVCRRLANEG